MIADGRWSDEDLLCGWSTMCNIKKNAGHGMRMSGGRGKKKDPDEEDTLAAGSWGRLKGRVRAAHHTRTVRFTHPATRAQRKQGVLRNLCLLGELVVCQPSREASIRRRILASSATFKRRSTRQLEQKAIGQVKPLARNLADLHCGRAFPGR
jgi:hypothetical protein